MITCMYCEQEFPDGVLLSLVGEHISNCESEDILKMQQEMNLGSDPYEIDDNTPAHTNNFDEEGD